ncbi:hypothetical protein AAG747_08630 [Rapidithrix thailandica]|uniref:Uncharacterized protein n=1 Tax=Rapidithrix thailandica TaxID=413964 RepID=A0AAW9S310_9BACT
MTEDETKIGSSRHFLERIANAIVEKSNTEEAFLKHFLAKRKRLIHFIFLFLITDTNNRYPSFFENKEIREVRMWIGVA